MKLSIFTIVLDGMPFLPMQLNTFNRLSSDFHWHIAHGAAANVNDTAWCKPQEPRLSRDGSTEFLASIKDHPRVTVLEKPWWEGGKTQMCNACLAEIKEPCVLLEADVDELWTPAQIEKIVWFLSPPGVNSAAKFFCRFFVGPNIVTVGENCYGNNPGEWSRAWKFEPGMVFEKHEPPIIRGFSGSTIPRDMTRTADLVFDHWAYYFEHQVAYKQQFYGYKDAVKHWRRLQANTVWPTKLKTWLPWVDDRATADLLHKP